MWSLVKKDSKLMLRDRKSLLVTLLMPIVLIAILGFSLKDVMETDDLSFHAVVGIVSEQSEERAWQQFVNDLENKAIPKPLKEVLIANGKDIQPERMLVEEVFQSESLRDNLEVVRFNTVAEAERSLKAHELTVLFIFPERFSYALWEFMFFDKDEGEVVAVKTNDKQQLAAETVVRIVDGFYEQMTFSHAVSKQLIDQAMLEGETKANALLFEPMTESFGEVVSISEKGTLSSFKYYTLAMAIMFVLFSASYGAIQAFAEKEDGLYERLIVANASRGTIILSKWIAVLGFAFLQFIVLLGSSFLFYDVRWENLGGILLIGLFLCMTVGSMAVLLTAINYRLNQMYVAIGFMGGGVAILSLFGGSFTPIERLPEIVKVIGEYTMTGASMHGFLLLEQGFSIGDIQQVLLTIFLNALILFVIAIGIWPRGVGR